MVSIYVWNLAKESGAWLADGACQMRLEERSSSRDLLWIDLDSPSTEDEALVFNQLLSIHPLTHSKPTESLAWLDLVS
jgi:hypothetical protein